ncbi:MAG: nucleotidyl transferase AbiEii/AbiGii toxin family protein, partial [Patescibacteria group bacterium]
EEIDVLSLSSFWKSKKKELNIKGIDFQQSFNRNLYFLQIDKETIKTEFTYYPFPRIEVGIKEFGLEIDNILDIAVNKLFTIYQQPRTRDYIDLYMICKKYKYPILDLIAKSKIKFDWHIDPLQLGAQFLKATEVKDYPRLIDKIPNDVWQNFFIEEAKKLKGEILE